mmetsp:Transcript_56381/g.163499  ORF Transcript_56381/g.163499 Transcript_56381/m.163499 type:complete len:117 (-) Transcript_56381:467-817(-)
MVLGVVRQTVLALDDSACTAGAVDRFSRACGVRRPVTLRPGDSALRDALAGMSLKLLLFTLQRHVLPSGLRVDAEVDDLLAHLQRALGQGPAAPALAGASRAARCPAPSAGIGCFP